MKTDDGEDVEINATPNKILDSYPDENATNSAALLAAAESEERGSGQAHSGR